MQGSVAIESEPGVGSTFIVTVTLDAARRRADLPPTCRSRICRSSCRLPDPRRAPPFARYLRDAGAEVDVGCRPSTAVSIDGAKTSCAWPISSGRGGAMRWCGRSRVRPAARAADRPASKRRARPARLSGRVLVVDDNSVNRKILARQLELAGASTDVAARRRGGPATVARAATTCCWPTCRCRTWTDSNWRGTSARGEAATAGRAARSSPSPPAPLEERGRAQPGGRHGRLHHQAGRHRAVARDPRRLAEGCGRDARRRERGLRSQQAGRAVRRRSRPRWPRSSASSSTPRAAPNARSAPPTICETIARAAHRLKGASGMIGAEALSRVAAAVERAAKAQRPARRAPAGRELQRVTRVCRSVRRVRAADDLIVSGRTRLTPAIRGLACITASASE